MRMKLVAMILWAAAWYTTGEFVAAMMPHLSPIAIMTIATAAQAVLTSCQSAAWSGRPNLLSAIAVAIDTMINAGGLWQIAPNFGATPTAELMTATAGPVGPGGLLAITMVGGLLLAYGPEAAWNQED